MKIILNNRQSCVSKKIKTRIDWEITPDNSKYDVCCVVCRRVIVQRKRWSLRQTLSYFLYPLSYTKTPVIKFSHDHNLGLTKFALVEDLLDPKSYFFVHSTGCVDLYTLVPRRWNE